MTDTPAGHDEPDEIPVASHAAAAEAKNSGCFVGAVCLAAVCIVLSLFGLILASSQEQFDSYPPNPLHGGSLGSFEPGEQDQVVPLTPYADTEINGVGPCVMNLVYDNTPGTIEFATADPHNRHQGCYMSVSVDFNGSYSEWETYFPGETIVVRAEPGTHIRGIAFEQCYPPLKDNPPPMESIEPEANPTPPTVPHSPEAPVGYGCFTVWRPLPGLAGQG